MNEISNDYINDCSENYLSNFLTGPRTSADIPKHEKRAIWDGSILVYKDSLRRKDGLERIPIQLKGTIQEFKGKFSISKDELIAYQSEQGVIFFVVKMNIDKDGQIIKDDATVYYALLTRNVIDRYLKRIEDSQSISVDFKLLESKNVLCECRKFLYAKKVYNNHETIEESDLNKIESVSISMFGDEEISDLLFNEDVIALAKIKGREKEKILNISGFKTAQQVIASVKLDDKVKYDYYHLIKEQNKIKLLFDDNVFFELPIKNGKLDKTQGLNITIKYLTNLEKSISQVDFMCEFLNAKSITIGDIEIELKEFNIKTEELNNFKAELELRKSNLLNIKKVCDDFSITDFDLSNFTKSNLCFVNDYLAKRLEVKKGHPDFGLYKLGNKTIFFKILKNEDVHCELINGFNVLNENYPCKINENQMLDCPILIQLNKQVLINSDNIDFAKINLAIEDLKLDNKFIIQGSTQFLITLIKCFDETQKEDYLISALNLCDKIKSADYNLALVNEIQIKKRMNIDVDIELENLAKILEKNKKLTNIFKCCASILLENKFEVKKYMKILKKNELKMLKDWPIYNLYSD